MKTLLLIPSLLIAVEIREGEMAGYLLVRMLAFRSVMSRQTAVISVRSPVLNPRQQHIHGKLCPIHPPRAPLEAVSALAQGERRILVNPLA